VRCHAPTNPTKDRFELRDGGACVRCACCGDLAKAVRRSLHACRATCLAKLIAEGSLVERLAIGANDERQFERRWSVGTRQRVWLAWAGRSCCCLPCGHATALICSPSVGSAGRRRLRGSAAIASRRNASARDGRSGSSRRYASIFWTNSSLQRRPIVAMDNPVLSGTDFYANQVELMRKQKIAPWQQTSRAAMCELTNIEARETRKSKPFCS
jgi:hypothetical protein